MQKKKVNLVNKQDKMIELVKRRKEKMVPRSHPQNCWNWALSLPLSHLHHSYIGTSRSISPLWRQRKLERERERIPSKKRERESICVSSYIYRLPNGSFPFSLVTYSAKPLQLCVTVSLCFMLKFSVYTHSSFLYSATFLSEILWPISSFPW